MKTKHVIILLAVVAVITIAVVIWRKKQKANKQTAEKENPADKAEPAVSKMRVLTPQQAADIAAKKAV